MSIQYVKVEKEKVLKGESRLCRGEVEGNVVRLRCELGVPSYKKCSGEWKGIDWDDYKRVSYNGIIEELWRLGTYDLGKTLTYPLVVWIKNRATLTAPAHDINNIDFKHIIDAIAIAYGIDDDTSKIHIHLTPKKEFGSEIIIAPQKEFLIELQNEIDKEERQYFE